MQRSCWATLLKIQFKMYLQTTFYQMIQYVLNFLDCLQNHCVKKVERKTPAYKSLAHSNFVVTFISLMMMVMPAHGPKQRRTTQRAPIRKSKEKNMGKFKVTYRRNITWKQDNLLGGRPRARPHLREGGALSQAAASLLFLGTCWITVLNLLQLRSDLLDINNINKTVQL